MENHENIIKKFFYFMKFMENIFRDQTNIMIVTVTVAGAGEEWGIICWSNGQDERPSL